jgi:hypothetical protein
LGPAGPIAAVAFAPFLETMAMEVLREVGLAGKRRGAEVLGVASEVTALEPEVLMDLIRSDEKYSLLAATAIIGATHTRVPQMNLTLSAHNASLSWENGVAHGEAPCI